MIRDLRATFLCSEQTDQVRYVIKGEFGFFSPDASSVPGIHAKDADIVKRVHQIRIIQERRDGRAIDKLQKGGHLWLLRFGLL
ncbi:MAG: hypothetical protein IKR78_02885, partial [Dehalococcoidales bacterium]|nr:hypothetical protein [Dehalococcoidales bacterium]